MARETWQRQRPDTTRHADALLDGNSAAVVRTAEGLLDHAREELRRADSKALQGLAAAGAIAALWSAPFSNGTWQLEELGLAASIGWWAACGFWLVAAGSFGAAAYPRLSPARTDVVAYFGDVTRLARDPHRLSAALRDAAAVPADGLLMELVWTSRTALRKYQLVRLGFTATALSAAGMLIALI